MIVLGISAFYHDSSATLVKDGKILSAAQEERFSRKKGDADFPSQAIAYCLSEADLILDQVDYVGFYDKPLLTFDRLLETYISFAPSGLGSFVKSIPIWVKEKIFQKNLLIRELNALELGNIYDKKLLFGFHHHSYAASAFYPSPFEEAAVLVLDGVGEWATTTLGHGKGDDLNLLKEIKFPHSLGMLYSAFTYYLGFKINDGEYKVMGLAPYGQPKYLQTIYDNLIDVKEDGSFRMNMEYFNYCTGLTMTNTKFDDLFGQAPCQTGGRLTQREMDLARSLQVVTEEILLKLAVTAHRETGSENLCMAGGVALNCVANGRILREGPFRNLWIQPAAGDAGASLGVALAISYEMGSFHRKLDSGERDSMNNTYLGPAFDSSQIKQILDAHDARYQTLDDKAIFETTADCLADGKVIGWFQERMEFGPRALGNRSILGDARSPAMQQLLNLKIKYRESFRPFAPVVLEEDASDYFDLDCPSPYMLLVTLLNKGHLQPLSQESGEKQGIDKLNVVRSTIPAVTHVDNSARIQTVNADSNPRLYQLIKTFKDKTGCGLLVNTSFNVRDEPIVCNPEDAYRCFMGSEMDVLVLGNEILFKEQQ